MTTDQITKQVNNNGDRRRPRLSTWLLAFLALALAISNLLTLMSDGFHAAGFVALKSIAGIFLADAALSRALSRSPTLTHETLLKSNAELRKTAVLRAETAKRVASRVAARAAKNAGKNLSSVPIEVIPLVGKAAILALTASDLYDDCQTLKDMNELNIAHGHSTHEETTVCGLKVPHL